MEPKRGYVYIMASRRNGTITIGVTSDLARRIWEHRTGVVSSFTRKYECKSLVWHLVFDDIQEARVHELRMKKWNRAWKLREIEETNPLWNDLYATLAP